MFFAINATSECHKDKANLPNESNGLSLVLPMNKSLLLFCFLVYTKVILSQKPFVGSFEYNIQQVDLLTKDTTQGKLFIYALDSLVRFNYLLENGKKQESIHHLSKHKLLTLLEIEGQFFAVQILDTAKESREFNYQRTPQKLIIGQLKSQVGTVQFEGHQESLYWHKKISAKYFVGYNDAPGLPTYGRIPTDYGYMAFELLSHDQRKPPFLLFVPEQKYKVLTLAEFLDWTKGGSHP